MTETLQRLQTIGIDELFRRTHIAKHNLERILAEEFEGIPRIQFMGFLSIIEREFGLDAASLRDEYDRRVPREEDDPLEPRDMLRMAGTEPAGRPWFKIVGVAFALAVVLYIVLTYMSRPASAPVSEINDSVIERAQNAMAAAEAAAKSSAAAVEAINPDANESAAASESNAPVEPERIVLEPNARIWIGVIELPEYTKRQKLTSQPYELNTSRDWLLMLGHGYLSIREGNETKRYQDRDKLFFIFEDGQFSQITKTEFVERNRGRSW